MTVRTRSALACLGAFLALDSAPFAPPARAWDDATHERIVQLATQLMPPALRQQIERNQDALSIGVLAPDRSGPAESHAFQLDGSGGSLDRDAAAAAARTVALLREQGGFPAVVRELGMVGHLVSDAAFPLNTSASDPHEGEYYRDYAAYAGRKLDRFPPIFGGYVRLDQGFDVAGYVRSVAEASNRSYARVGAGYFPGGGGAMKASSTFDDRGPVFGVTSIAFTRAVTATANVWLWIWREAHGDLDRTPHYAEGGLGRAQDRAGAAQRP